MPFGDRVAKLNLTLITHGGQIGEKCVRDISLFQLTRLNKNLGVPLHCEMNVILKN